MGWYEIYDHKDGARVLDAVGNIFRNALGYRLHSWCWYTKQVVENCARPGPFDSPTQGEMTVWRNRNFKTIIHKEWCHWQPPSRRLEDLLQKSHCRLWSQRQRSCQHSRSTTPFQIYAHLDDHQHRLSRAEHLFNFRKGPWKRHIMPWIVASSGLGLINPHNSLDVTRALAHLPTVLYLANRLSRQKQGRRDGEDYLRVGHDVNQHVGNLLFYVSPGPVLLKRRLALLLLTGAVLCPLPQKVCAERWLHTHAALETH